MFLTRIAQYTKVDRLQHQHQTAMNTKYITQYNNTTIQHTTQWYIILPLTMIDQNHPQHEE